SQHFQAQFSLGVGLPETWVLASTPVDVITRSASRRAETLFRCSPRTALGTKEAECELGCDLHARQQTLAMLDTVTGEVVNRTLLGLIPGERSSGRRQRLGKITKQGSPLLRFLWSEAGVHAVRRDPELKHFYRRKLA